MDSEILTNALKIITDDTTFFDGISPRVKKLYEQAKEDCAVSRFNIRDKSLLISTYRTKWFMILTKERQVLNQLKASKEAYIDNEVLRLSHGTSLPKVAIKAQIANSEAVVSIDAKITEQEELVSFITGIRAIFDDFSYTINNALNAITQENT